jgi:hypothetical protein
LDPTIQVTNVFNSLDRALHPPPYLKKPKKFDEIPEITRICEYVFRGLIIPMAFNDLKSNPDSKIVKQAFVNLGIKNIYKFIRDDFEKQWGLPISVSFIPDKLDEIVGRRHKIAHGQILNVTRVELKEAVRFLRSLSIVINNSLAYYITQTILSNNPSYILLAFMEN